MDSLKGGKQAPYTTGDITTFKRQDSGGSDDGNPLTVFDDQKKVQAKQKQEEEVKQWDDRIQSAIWTPSTWLHSK